jgi:large-conductance mechanosensitive channel
MCLGIIIFVSLSNLIDRFCRKSFNLKTFLWFLLSCVFASVSIVGVWLNWGTIIKIVITIGLLSTSLFMILGVKKEFIEFEKKNNNSEDEDVISYMENEYIKDKIKAFIRQIYILFLFCLLIVGMWMFL